MTDATPRPETALAPLSALARPGGAAIGWRDGAGRPVTLWTWRSEGWRPDGPVVVSLHGVGRNAWDYRDFWRGPAERHGLLVVAMEFDRKAFPGGDGYNLGGALDREGRVAPSARRAFAAPARMIADLRAAGFATGADLRLYGHSAGAQFAHRMLALEGAGPFREIAAANAGWWTPPTLAKPFPAGLGALGLDRATLARFLAHPLTLLAGERDVETDDPNLSQRAAARAQGPHRLARARWMLARGAGAAAALGVPFGWRLIEVGGVGHDGDAMAQAVAALWHGGATPGIARRPLAGAP